jgi:cardiolipin synthase
MINKKIFENIWTIPNIMSMIRFILAPVIGHLIYHQHLLWAIIIAFIAGMLDILDGIIARRYGMTSEFGKVIDPLADKVTYGFVVISMLLVGMLPLWYVFFFILRDLLLLLGGLIFSKKIDEVPQADKLGKYTIFVNAMSIFLILCGVKELNSIYLILPLTLLYVSTFNYFWKGFKKLKMN